METQGGSSRQLDRNDACYMARALQLAQRGLWTTDPNPRVGCVIVRDACILGEGWHQYAGEAHAEIHALQNAGTGVLGAGVLGATAYVTLEPCCHYGRTPPCTEALIEAGIGRVVVASTDPDPRVSGQGVLALERAGVEVIVGLMQDEAEALNPGFISRHRQGRPYVRCKMAMTLDGRTATASGESQWITGPAARRDVHRLRARSAAVMTGIGTVLADDPRLTARIEAAECRDGLQQPCRVVLDSRLRIPVDAAMLSQGGRNLIVHCQGQAIPACLDVHEGVELLAVPNCQGSHQLRVDLGQLMSALASQGLNEILLEAGPTLSGAMLSAGYVDELWIYMAPTLLGDAARGLLALPGIDCLDEAIGLHMSDVRAIGQDWRIIARLAEPKRIPDVACVD